MSQAPVMSRETNATSDDPPVVDAVVDRMAGGSEGSGATAFRQTADRVLRHSRRSGEGFALVVLDIDRFRDVNDAFGPAFADALLCSVQRRLRETVREGDLIAHLGTDRFGVLLIDADDGEGTAKALARIAAACSSPLACGDVSLCVTASVGGCLWSPGVTDAGALLYLAEQALARAKAAGGASSGLIVPEAIAGHDAAVNAT